MLSSTSTTTTTTMALSSALVNRPAAFSTTKSHVFPARRGRTISCDVALRSNVSAASVSDSVENDTSSSLSSSSSSSSSLESLEEEKLSKKIGSRVKVSVPLKVYHIPRVPQVDLTGREGVLKDYVALWKGKRISANLPYKIEFVMELEGRGPVKFFAHLKEDEFEYLD